MSDVTIIGASLAGATCAAQLAAAGIAVTVIDRAAVAGRKACGEGISHRAVAALEEAGLAQLFFDLHPHPVSRFLIRTGDSSRTPISITSPAPIVYGISRSTLDPVLRSAATTRGATLVVDEVRSLLVTDTSCTILTKESTTIRSKWVVVADGARSLLDTLPGTTVLETGITRHGASLHIPTTDECLPHTVQAFFRHHARTKAPYELILTPTEQSDIFNVSIMGSKESLQRESIRGALQQVLPSLGDYPMSDLRGAPLVGFRRRQYSPGPFLAIGDAAEQLDPIGGLGMTHAITSGVLAANAILEQFASSASAAAVSLKYQRERERLARPFRGYSKLSGSGVQLTDCFPKLSNKLLPTMGRLGLHGLLGSSWMGEWLLNLSGLL